MGCIRAQLPLRGVSRGSSGGHTEDEADTTDHREAGMVEAVEVDTVEVDTVEEDITRALRIT